MTDLWELKSRLTRLHESCDEIIAKADAEGRGLNDAERDAIEVKTRAFDELGRDIGLREAAIERENQLMVSRRKTSHEVRPEDQESGLTRTVEPPGTYHGSDFPMGSGSSASRGRRQSQNSTKTFGDGWARLGATYAATDAAGFGSITEFLRSVKRTVSGDYDRRLAKLSMGEGSGSVGGFLVPAKYEAEILATAMQSEPWLMLRKIFRIERGTGNSVITPQLADQDRSGGDVANISLDRIGEGQTIPSAPIKLQQRQMTMSKAAKLIVASNELFDDSVVGLDGLVREVFARALAMRQSTDCISGSGVAQPTGILNSESLVLAESSSAADTISLADLAAMVERLPNAGDAASVAWLMHPSAIGQLLTLETTNGQLVWAANARDDRPRMLFGYPVFVSDACKPVGDAGDIILADWSQYLYMIGRVGVDVDRSSHFTSDETAFRLVLRDAGGPAYATKLKDRQGFEQSAFIALAERTGG